ncbi:hypothetical protein U1Q18_044821 [Sarracenia purpurea var. burkii]
MGITKDRVDDHVGRFRSRIAHLSSKPLISASSLGNCTGVESHNGKIALRDLSRWLAGGAPAHGMGYAGKFLKHSAQRYQSQNRLPGRTQDNTNRRQALRSSPPERLHKTRASRAGKTLSLHEEIRLSSERFCSLSN